VPLAAVVVPPVALLPVAVPPVAAVVPPVAVVVPPVVVLPLDVLEPPVVVSPVAVVVPCVAFIGGIMELMLVSWQMRFSVGMDEVFNLCGYCDDDDVGKLCTYAVSERYFFRVLIPAYVARNICHGTTSAE